MSWKGKGYTGKENEIIRTMCELGCTIQEIADRLGKSRQAISKHMSKLGVSVLSKHRPSIALKGLKHNDLLSTEAVEEFSS